MSERDWKNEPSALAVEAVSQAEDVSTKMAQSVEEAMTRGVDQQRDFMKMSAQQFGDASRNFVGDDAAKAEELFAHVGPTVEGLQEMQHYVAALVEGVVRTNLRLAQEIFLVESPRAFVELQQRFLVEYFAAFQRGVSLLIGATNRPA